MLQMRSEIGTDHGGFVDLSGDAGLIRIALPQTFHHIGDVFLDRLGRDAVLFVVGNLLFAASVGFPQSPFHRACYPICVHDDATFSVPCGATNGLDERGFGAQETLFVCIENGHEATFGNVQTFAQQVDPDQYIECAKTQIAQNFDPLQRVDIRVHVAHPCALLVQIFGQIFGHALC